MSRRQLASVVFRFEPLNVVRAHIAKARAHLAVLRDDGVARCLRREAADAANQLAQRAGQMLWSLYDDRTTHPAVRDRLMQLFDEAGVILRESYDYLHERDGGGAALILLMPPASLRAANSTR